MGGRCLEHVAALTVRERADLVVADRLRKASDDLQRRSHRNAAAATSFAVAGSAMLLATGAGALGVVAISGLIAGIYFLFSE